MKQKIIILGIILMILAVILYCAAPDRNFSAMQDIKAMLENNYGTVTVKEEEKMILRGECYVLSFRHVLDHAEETIVTVYVYESVEKAKEDAATITPDGFGIERQGLFGVAESMQISWVNAPHFFLYKNVIVQYIGMDFELLQCLYHLCGSQIAGQPFIDSPLIERAMMSKSVQYFPGNEVQACSYPLCVEKSVDNC